MFSLDSSFDKIVPRLIGKGTKVRFYLFVSACVLQANTPAFPQSA